MIVNLSMVIPSGKPKITGDIYGLNQGVSHILIYLGTCSKHNINFINLVFIYIYIHVYLSVQFYYTDYAFGRFRRKVSKLLSTPKKMMDEHHHRRRTFHYSMANKGDISCTITRDFHEIVGNMGMGQYL
jgi:hypothetical protein